MRRCPHSLFSFLPLIRVLPQGTEIDYRIWISVAEVKEHGGCWSSYPLQQGQRLDTELLFETSANFVTLRIMDSDFDPHRVLVLP